MRRSHLIAGLLLATCVGLAIADEPKTDSADANDLLRTGLAKSKKEGKPLFLVFGSPTCRWCRIFEKYHADNEVAAVTNQHLVLVNVDIEENPGGQKLYEKHGKMTRGVPAWTILDADGRTLVDSDNGQGNVGFPYQDAEIEHYFSAYKKACPQLTEKEVELLAAKLKEVRPKPRTTE